MKSLGGVSLMVLGIIGITRGGVLDQGLAMSSNAILIRHSPPLAALVGAFLFVGGLMLLAKRDSFLKEASRPLVESPLTDPDSFERTGN